MDSASLLLIARRMNSRGPPALSLLDVPVGPGIDPHVSGYVLAMGPECVTVQIKRDQSAIAMSAFQKINVWRQ